MGFFKRWKFLSTPRAQGSGKIWDNTNSPGTNGTTLTTMSGNATQETAENYYQPGPNPEPYLRTGESKNPARLHSHLPIVQPPVPNRVPSTDIGNETYINVNGPVANPRVVAKARPLKTMAPTFRTIRELEYDGASQRSLQRFNFVTTTSQRYYNERTPLPEFTTPSVLAHEVRTTPLMFRSGWSQAHVPEPGMSVNHIGHAPPWLMSSPMHVTTTSVGNDGHRSPIKNARAPKRIRSA